MRGVDENQLCLYLVVPVDGLSLVPPNTKANLPDPDDEPFLAVALAAWKVRFLEDDAFITYRFSRNLAQGRGLVFNPGEKVEGYTNFLWTVIHAIPEKLGWNTPAFSQVLGIVLIVATTAVSAVNVSSDTSNFVLVSATTSNVIAAAVRASTSVTSSTSRAYA